MVFKRKQVFLPLLFGLINIFYLRGNDTILVSSMAKPFFYNVVKTSSEKVFAGTSDGMYEIRGLKLYKKNEEKGYITLDENAQLRIDPDGIKNYEERRLLHLLPYPDRGREEYHVGTKDYLYIVSNGTLYIFEFTHFKITYPNMSIRTISKHLIGGYSGVFFNGKKLRLPPFCDGYIREINQKAFVCYSDLLAFNMPVNPGDTTLTPVDLTSLKQVPYKYISDIHYSNTDHSYYLSSQGKLLNLDKDLIKTSIIYTFDGENTALLGSARTSLIFSADTRLLSRKYVEKNIDTLATLDQVILDGFLTSKNYYILTKDALHVLYSDGTLKKLTMLNDAHTILGISTTEMLIGSNAGLFLFNTVDNTLSTVIEGVEFNRKALFLNENIVYAGSITGLYSFTVASISELIQRNKYRSTFFDENTKYYVFALLLCIIIIAWLIRLLTLMRKKLNANKQALDEATTPEVTRQMIEDYIRENLATASINSINDHFNTNSTYVYSLFEPEKPGSFIQHLRMQLVADMKKKGHKIPEISEVTGLSESYIRKLKV